MKHVNKQVEEERVHSACDSRILLIIKGSQGPGGRSDAEAMEGADYSACFLIEHQPTDGTH